MKHVFRATFAFLASIAFVFLLLARAASNEYVAAAVDIVDDDTHNALAFEAVASVTGSVPAVYFRGVILQGLAVFRDEDDSLIDPSKIEIVAKCSDGSFLPCENGIQSYCITAPGMACQTLPLIPSELRLAALFVERGKFGAMTLGSDAPSWRQEPLQKFVARNDLVPISQEWVIRSFRALSQNISFDRLLQAAEYSENKLLIARPFAGKYSTSQLLTRIDLDIAFEDLQRYRKIRRQIVAQRNLGAPERPANVRPEDSSYVVADFDARFTVRMKSKGQGFAEFRCDGLPARYDWSQYKDYNRLWIDDVIFPPDLHKAELPPNTVQFLTDALNLYCTTAVLRRLKEVGTPSFRALFN